ncbi:MAG TPA: peptidoglycan DD-metalloendopeptidase family protein [Spirochaetia bacterium]
MPGKHRERLYSFAQHRLIEPLATHRRHVLTAVGLVLVAGIVFLVLDARVPFPRPGERIVYDPSDWSLLFRPDARVAAPQEMAVVSGPSVGGVSIVQAPIDILVYKAKPGDTMSKIATKLGMDVDTVSSMNRVQGRGVHNVTVGELLRIPSQDGIYMTLSGDFDAMCKKYNVYPDDVLAANAITRDKLVQGMQLFFPNVQHTGYARALAVGVGVALPLHGWETDPFGGRRDPFTGLPSHHTGVDIAAPEGSAIRSATDGVVVQAGWDNGYGNFVQVRAQLGYSYIYGHMSKILTRVGARIATGQVIGLVGHTGYATGPHLHFEVRLNGVPQNPRNYLPGIR